MRKLMTALIFSLVMAGLAAPSGAAIAKPDADQALILKKKKRLAALKAAAVAEEAALAKAEASARKKKRLEASSARNKQGVRVVRTAGAKAKPALRKEDKLLAERSRPRRDCGSFLKCLFAKKQRPVRVASIDPNFTGGASGLSGRTMRETVDFNDGKYKPGSIIVRTAERALYYVLPGGEAIRYSVGVGKEGFQWGGKSTIVRKQEWPSWTPPQVMIEREAAKGHIIPPFMEGGPGNPLGARAMYIGGTMFRVHGTNNEASIGGAVSSGCIRMMNADVVDLYDRVRVGAPIHVIQ